MITKQPERFELLGTDGGRGIWVPSELGGPVASRGDLNAQSVAYLTYAHAMIRLANGHGNSAVLGMDPRQANRVDLEDAAIAGLMAAGVSFRNIHRLGITPTPTVLRYVQQHKLDMGIVLTASHNTSEWAGVKVTNGPDKPYRIDNDNIENKFWEIVNGNFDVPTRPNKQIPVTDKAHEEYASDVVAAVSQEFNERPLVNKSFVIDGAYGAGGSILVEVFEALGAKVYPYACDHSEPINHNAGATDLKGVQQFLRNHPEILADPNLVGVITNDGDNDRFKGMGIHPIIDAEGEKYNVIDGNRTAELLATNEPGVVGTWYSNDASIDRIKQNKLSDGGPYTQFEFCDNGDTEVTHKLIEFKWNYGYEFSGHNVLRSWLSSGDGILTAARVAAMAVKLGQTFDQICEQRPLWPERMLGIKLKAGLGDIALADAGVVNASELTDRDHKMGLRFMVRESGTERDNMRIWGVGRNKSYVDKRVLEIANAMDHFADKPRSKR